MQLTHYLQIGRYTTCCGIFCLLSKLVLKGVQLPHQIILVYVVWDTKALSHDILQLIVHVLHTRYVWQHNSNLVTRK